MTRVTGIGGVFIKARDPKTLRAWYRDHLGIPVQDWGGATFQWAAGNTDERPGATVWSVMPVESTYFAPSQASFMINYRVANLAEMLDTLRAEGCDVDDRTEESEFGKFGWVMDPEGNRIELWEPPLGAFPG
jgi:predicted enzyme related to lactoylglutathione lyase